MVRPADSEFTTVACSTDVINKGGKWIWRLVPCMPELSYLLEARNAILILSFPVCSLLQNLKATGCTALTDDIANILNEASSHRIVAIGAKDQNNGSYC
jgi:hypothetical protein